MATTTWIIAADSSRARVLQVADPKGEQLLEIEDLINPSGRMQDRDLQSDAAPRFNGHGGVGKPGTSATGGPGSDRETQGAVEHSVEVFARQLGDYLEKARNQHRYDRLVLVAPPKFLGALRKNLGKEVEKLVVDDLDKDLSWLRTRDLGQHLRGAGRAR